MLRLYRRPRQEKATIEVAGAQVVSNSLHPDSANKQVTSNVDVRGEFWPAPFSVAMAPVQAAAAPLVPAPNNALNAGVVQQQPQVPMPQAAAPQPPPQPVQQVALAQPVEPVQLPTTLDQVIQQHPHGSPFMLAQHFKPFFRAHSPDRGSPDLRLRPIRTRKLLWTSMCSIRTNPK